MNEWSGGGDEAAVLARGVCRLLRDLGYTPLTEFKLTSKRRVDVIGLDRAGRFAVVEIKSSVADFRADAKWPEYEVYGDRFYFAVGRDFPAKILPGDRGLIVADGFGAAIARAAAETPMNGTRRRAQILRFAAAAGDRLHRMVDPGI
jgi:hypothetical protein